MRLVIAILQSLPCVSVSESATSYPAPAVLCGAVRVQIRDFAAPDDFGLHTVHLCQIASEGRLIAASHLPSGGDHDPKFLKLGVVGVLFDPAFRVEIFLPVGQLLVVFAVVVFRRRYAIRVA